MRFSDTSRLFERKAAPLSDFTRVLRRLNIDGPLLGALLLTSSLGLVVLYSAVSQNIDLWLQQCARLFVALIGMLVVAQLPPDLMRRWTPWGYLVGLILLGFFFSMFIARESQVPQMRQVTMTHQERASAPRAGTGMLATIRSEAAFIAGAVTTALFFVFVNLSNRNSMLSTTPRGASTFRRIHVR